MSKVIELSDHRKPARRKAVRVNLTPKRIESAEASEKRIRIADADVVGLYLVIQPSGHKSFVARGRIGGGRSRPMVDVTIGSTSAVSLVDARKAAKVILGEMRAGIDPRKRSSGEISTKAMIAMFLDYHASRGTITIDKISRCLNRASYGLGEQPFSEVSLEQWSGAVSRSYKSRGLAPATDDAKFIKALGNWAHSEGVARGNEARDVNAPKPSHRDVADTARRAKEQWTLQRSEWNTFWTGTEAGKPDGPRVIVSPHSIGSAN